MLSRFLRGFSPIIAFQLQEMNTRIREENAKREVNGQKKPPVLPRRLNVTLIRHAETDLNVNHRLQGWIDAPLSDTGLVQAAELGNSLKMEVYDMAYSSDLDRAIQTLAEVQKRTVGYKPNPIQDKRLRERGFGVAENTDIQLYREQVAEHAKHGKEYMYTPEGGETYEKFGGRIKEFMLDLFQMIDEDEGGVEHVLIVSHGLWILTMMKYLKEKPDLFVLENFDPDSTKISPRNSAVAKFEIYPKGNDGKRLIRFVQQNNYDHLSVAPRSGYSDPDPDTMKENLGLKHPSCACGCKSCKI